MAIPPVVALEIGTSKVVALVGEMREDGHIVVTGIGEHESTGVRKGEIVDLQNVALCVRAALGIAEETGKVTINQVHVAVSGGHIQGIINSGEVPVLDPSGRIAQDDVDSVMEVAQAVNLPPDREMLHTLCQHFRIDNQDDVIDPEGMVGAKLSLNMLLIHGVRARLYNVINVVRSVPVEVSDVAFSGLCSALAVLTAEQKRSGVIVVDLGGGTTDYVVYADDVVAAGGAFGLGGDHITNDIALAFKIPTSEAERLKRESGSAILDASATASKQVVLPPEGGFQGRTVNLKALHTVINARADEILVMVRKRLEKENVLHHIGAGIVLTGGGARLRGIAPLAEKIFDLPCSIGKPINVSGLAVVTDGPEYATCSGLVLYGFEESDDRDVGASVLGALKKIFRGWK
jgi:cell division protein FtsA